MADKTASTQAITRFLNGFLQIRLVDDDSRNGMQVRAKESVSKAGLAVDACMSTFKKACRRDCDLLIVHHGLFWRGQRDILGMRKELVEYLLKNRMSLYASHLPLDMHPLVGNNAVLSKRLGLSGIKPFHRYNNSYIGCWGTLPKRMGADDFRGLVETCLGAECDLMGGGVGRVRTIGVVSGGGGRALYDCPPDIDCLVTGEAPHNIQRAAAQLGVKLVLGGHYQTETLGVSEIGNIIRQRFGIKASFIKDAPI